MLVMRLQSDCLGLLTSACVPLLLSRGLVFHDSFVFGVSRAVANLAWQLAGSRSAVCL